MSLASSLGPWIFAAPWKTAPVLSVEALSIRIYVDMMTLMVTEEFVSLLNPQRWFFDAFRR
jgi:hypothetical protein